MDRPECSIVDCHNMAGICRKNPISGKIYYSKFCYKHHKDVYPPHKKRVNVDRKRRAKARQFGDPNVCTLCGWKGPCDFHRIVPRVFGGEYKIGNVIVVCPNCHRLLHRNLLDVYTKQVAV